MSINLRINQLVAIKAGGNKSQFAKQIGWVPQYMTRVTKEDGPTGLAVVEQILTAFKDVNPRWLIFGEGEPLVLRSDLLSEINSLISILNNQIVTINQLSDEEAKILKIKVGQALVLFK